jgi:tetratricopeptide (TPR) repeat protein
VARALFGALTLTAALVAPADAQKEDKLGKVSFPTSCDPKVQAEFERGVAMLHSYWFTVARRTFEGVLKEDPGCAIAYWGVATDILGNTLVGPPSRQDAQKAWDVLEQARAVGAKTQRERDWIEALCAYYRDHDKVPVDARLRAYTQALEHLTDRYPDDYEAQVFYALALQASASKADKTYANQLKSAAILEKLYQQNPQHPGVTHFIIHAYDFPALADKGIAAANRYAGIAPAVPHARHMPSHIYSMVGMWEESIASNVSSMEIQPDYYHAADFAVYAHLQLAQDSKAKAMIDQSLATADRGDRPITFVNFTAKAAMPARYALERGDWGGAAALPISKSQFPQADSLTRFARAIGMARAGNVAAARTEIEEIKALREALAKANQTYWADRSEEQMLAASGWVAFLEGDRARAVRLLRAAADGEDASVKHVAMENRLYPMRELLAELLLEIGQPADALKEYEAALGDNPNRYRGYWGAARAAEKAGQQQKATSYYRKLVDLAAKGDGQRPEVQHAKSSLARN